MQGKTASTAPARTPGAMAPPPTQFATKGTAQRVADGPGATVQRLIDGYKPGTNLAKTTLAKRGLTQAEQTIVQRLHDDLNKTYTVDDARQIARGSAGTNPYAWDVIHAQNYNSTDSNIQEILDRFGSPMSSVVKTYDDLASRVGFDLKSGSTLSSSTVNDLQKLFDASKPLHFKFNSYLNDEWQDALDNYNGTKTGAKLYSVIRSKMTDVFDEEDVTGSATLNDILYEASGRAPEIHHLLYKSIYGSDATKPWNLVLAERSAKESVDGPGQHELMHKVFSGNHPNKFKVLHKPVVDEYVAWGKKKGILV